MKQRETVTVVLAGLALAISACADDASSRRTTVTQTPSSTGSTVVTERTATTDGSMSSMRRTMTDGNILAMLQAANTNEIEDGRLAQQRASSADVRLFASRMTQEHQMLMDQGSNLASRLNITPSLPLVDREKALEHEKTMDMLRNKSGESFDRAYLDHEILEHERVLRKVDDASLEAQNPDVKTLLAQVRPGIQAHLKAARDLQRDLTSRMP